MARFRGLLALGVLALAVDFCSAQGISVIGFSSTRFYGGGPVLRPPFCPPYAPYYPPYGIRENRVVVQVIPPPVFVEPPLFLEPRRPLGRLWANEEEELTPPVRPRPPAEVARPLPGQNAGGFRPVDQANRDRAARPDPFEPPEPPPAPPAPPPPAPPAESPDMPRLPAPPRDEAARLVTLGLAHFADREYGRAAERFRRAIARAPEARTYFLLAQALVALGKYAEAGDAVHEGLARDADWPRAKFQPLELYGDKPADYPAHLRRLEEAQARNDGDAALAFLRAYALWFDGRKDEARPLFEKARHGAREARAVGRFLEAMPGGGAAL